MTLLTGSTGFLGSNILKLYDKNNILTLSRTNSDFILDLSYEIPHFNCKFKKVIHAAGLAHLNSNSKIDASFFHKINVAGTINLLKGFENSFLPDHIIFISSVSVYGLNSGVGITENSSLLANDAYGLSKIKAEEIVINWCIKNNVFYTILRLPLIIGANSPGNLSDIINSIKNKFYFNIQNNSSKRSMVLVSDVSFFLKNISKVNGVFNLTDGYNPSIIELTNFISKQLDVKKPLVLPLFIFKFLALIGDKIYTKFPFNSVKLEKLTNTLTFDDSKARTFLGWRPNEVLNSFFLNC